MSDFKNVIEDQATELSDQAVKSFEETSDKADSALETSKSFIQSNQIPVVLGALAAGIVLGLLVPRKKPEPTASNLLDSRLDDLKEILGGLGSKVSSTTQDQYDGVTSAFNSAVKKAKKRFNLS